MSTGVTCQVLIDGVRAADGSPGEAPDAPAILEGLTVTWGRTDTMSQPEADSCSFTVSDPEGGEAFLGIYRTGARVDVNAYGLTQAATSTPTFTNPGFETATVTWVAGGAYTTRSSAHTNGGLSALLVTPVTLGQQGYVWLAPAPFHAPGTAPDAWDGIRTTVAGEVWTTTVDVRPARGTTAVVRPALFTGPYVSTGVPTGTAVTVLGDGAWHTVPITLPVDVDGQWLGMRVTFDGVGLAWDEHPAGMTWDTYGAGVTWDDTAVLYIDNADAITPSTPAVRTVLVFTGRITDVTASWDDSTGGPVAEVNAVGFTADLENRTIGGDPWPVEMVRVRSNRILNAAGLPIVAIIDSTIATTLLSWVDIDSQGAAGLLKEVATSVDSVLWPAVHRALGAYLRMEDPALREALLELAMDGTGHVAIVQSNPDAGFDLSACMILRDPVEWVQDVSDVVTRVAVTWKQQGVDDKGNPTTTDVTEYLIDAPLELLLGTRGVSVSTQLQAATDAQAVAARIKARTSPTGWRASGLSIDDDDVTSDAIGVATMLGLLGGSSRIGAPIIIGDMPGWAPSGSTTGVYLEGGTYAYVGGRWLLQLEASATTGVGDSVTWDELGPTWQWNQWAPQVRWNDLRGVSGPGT